MVIAKKKVNLKRFDRFVARAYHGGKIRLLAISKAKTFAGDPSPTSDWVCLDERYKTLELVRFVVDQKPKCIAFWQHDGEVNVGAQDHDALERFLNVPKGSIVF